MRYAARKSAGVSAKDPPLPREAGSTTLFFLYLSAGTLGLSLRPTRWETVSSRYLPPGEVSGLIFSDHQTLEWDPEPSTGIYKLCRNLISNLIGLGYGSCEQPKLANETVVDPDLPWDQFG